MLELGEEWIKGDVKWRDLGIERRRRVLDCAVCVEYEEEDGCPRYCQWSKEADHEEHM